MSPTNPQFNDGAAPVTAQTHTPGPWKIEENPVIDREHLIIPAHQSIGDGASPCVWIASIHSRGTDEDPDAPPPRQAKANARLIAAAPELLAALRDAAGTLSRLSKCLHANGAKINAQAALDMEAVVRAAIAKAEGR